MLDSFVGIKINNYEKIFSFKTDRNKLEEYLQSVLGKLNVFWDSIPEQLERINNEKIGEIKFYKRGNNVGTGTGKSQEENFYHGNGSKRDFSNHPPIIKKRGATEKET